MVLLYFLSSEQSDKSGTVCVVNPAILFLPEYDKFYLAFLRK